MKIRGFIIVGMLLCIASAGLCGFAATRDDFVLEEVYTDPNLERKEYELEDINAISFKGAAEDLEIIYTEDQSKIIYYDGKYKNYNIQAESGVLTINQEYKNHFFHYNFFTYVSNKCTIYINTSIEDLNIHLNAGKLKISDLTVKKAYIDMDAGNAELNQCNFDILEFDVDAGDMRIKNTVVQEMKASLSAGNFNFHGDVISNAQIYMNAGNVKLELKRPKEEYDSVILDIDVDAGKKSIYFNCS